MSIEDDFLIIRIPGDLPFLPIFQTTGDWKTKDQKAHSLPSVSGRSQPKVQTDYLQLSVEDEESVC